MARFRAEEVNNYGGQGGGGFFSIANDKEVKQVRLMYNTIDDVEGMSVHKVKVGEKERYVNCLREYNDPVDTCPFCREGLKTQARLFIPIYNIDEDTAQIWDKGKTMFQKITSLCNRYTNKDTNLVNNVFEIERNGKPKDMKTTYEFYNIDCDDTELEDLPESPKIFGGLVLDKSAEDMEYYLEEGQFPPTDDAEDEQPRRRESRTAERSSSRERETRRTPASRRKEDTF
jgi:hypothetical protein